MNRSIAGMTLLIMCVCAHSALAWFDPAWPFRRSVEVTWNADHGTGDDLAMVEFYTNGKQKPDGSDIRIATEDGRLIPQKVVMVGPGDRIRLIFSLQKDEKKYHVYWGNEKPPALEDKFAHPKIATGCLMEMKLLVGQATNSFRQIEQAWDNNKILIGRTLIDRPFLGVNPFNDDQSTISRIEGSLFIPQDGDYMFAVAADDRAAFYLDGKDVIYCPGGPPDIRHNAKVTLKRGPHSFVMYHVNFSSTGWFTLAWKRPDMANYDTIPRDAFGYWSRGRPGLLEERGKNFTADFDAEYLGESVVADRYTHHYRFTANLAKTLYPPTYTWDFGDGQSAQGAVVDHVYLEGGTFNVQVGAKVLEVKSTTTTRFNVSRQWERLARPEQENPENHLTWIEKYNWNKLSPESLLSACWLAIRANDIDAAFAPATELAGRNSQPELRAASEMFVELARIARAKGKTDELLAVFNRTPAKSNLLGLSARLQGQLLLWTKADFTAAATLLKDLPTGDRPARRMLGQAMLLAGKVNEGKKILLDLPAEEQPEKQVAISGAMARSVEFFITESDTETGEETWEKWQNRYPSDFLDGYSALLRVRLIEQRKNPRAAAKVAEAFADALPNSSYAPQLLDRASRLLEKIDPNRSVELRKQLKQRYPEDPLSQK